MNNGWPNQAIRCMHAILDRFVAEVRVANPAIETTRSHVQPRNLDEFPPLDCDMYLSSGGPGSPFEGQDDPWYVEYRSFLDGLAEDNAARHDVARKILLICHSFEIATAHFGIAEVVKRSNRKFGIQPAYMTEAGMASPLLNVFGDRLFAWENRNFHAVNVNTRLLKSLGGEVWARESRDGKSKGEAILAFKVAHGIEAVQFHPEADRRAVLTWLLRPDQRAATIEAFGELTYQRMLKTINDPMRMARTLALLIPRWLVRQFNLLAPSRDWKPIPMPVHDLQSAQAAFGVEDPNNANGAAAEQPTVHGA